MRYLVYDKDDIENVIIYCNKGGNETPEDIAKSIYSNTVVDKFVAAEHIANSYVIKNDENMFILEDSYGCKSIWQICSKVSDYNGFIVPHLYNVRKIGYITKWENYIKKITT